MRLLIRVVERQSFSAAASDLGMPRSSATTAIKEFEERLGVRQDHSPCHSDTGGELYYRRCKAILPEIEDAEAALTGSEVRGLLRIDVYGPRRAPSFFRNCRSSFKFSVHTRINLADYCCNRGVPGLYA